MAVVAGTVLGGTYRLVRQVGAGGMGEVWEAQHARLAGRYAVKFLLAQAEAKHREEIFARFKREAEVTSGLQHPHIVQVLDYNQTKEGVPYLVMEYLRGEDLSGLLARAGRLPVPRAIGIIRQVASGLAHAHAAGVVHRDLKPSNLFLVKVDGPDPDFVKILDFGISKVRAASRGLTAAQTQMGTAWYMAPEQARKVSEVDDKADQFSVGAILFEMLAGRPPFDAEEDLAVIYQILHEPPAPLPKDVPREVAAVVMRALEKDRERRFRSISEFARALDAAIGLESKEVTPPPTVPGFDARTRPGSGEAGGLRFADVAGLAPTAPALLENPKNSTFRAATGELGEAGASIPSIFVGRRARAVAIAGSAILVAAIVVAVSVGTRRPSAPGSGDSLPHASSNRPNTPIREGTSPRVITAPTTGSVGPNLEPTPPTRSPRPPAPTDLSPDFAATPTSHDAVDEGHKAKRPASGSKKPSVLSRRDTSTNTPACQRCDEEKRAFGRTQTPENRNLLIGCARKTTEGLDRGECLRKACSWLNIHGTPPDFEACDKIVRTLQRHP